MLIKKSLILICLLFSSLSFAKPVWIDVRTAQEQAIDGIAGDLQLEYNNILQKITELFPDKSTDLRLYCRSGRRAGIARMVLMKAGYQNVVNLGSVANVRKLRSMP